MEKVENFIKGDIMDIQNSCAFISSYCEELTQKIKKENLTTEEKNNLLKMIEYRLNKINKRVDELKANL